MRIINKLVRYLLIMAVVSFITSPLWIRLVPTKYFSTLSGASPLVDKIVCEFTTKVGGKSMSPLIASGSSLKFNRCFEREDLSIGKVIMYNDNSGSRLGIIRHIISLDPIVYKVSDEKAPELLHDVIKEEIVAIAKNIDTSTSGYRTKQESESFILDANEFLSDFYLAKIPRGKGIESSTVEKAVSFSRQNDKFCYVVVPKKKLADVSIEIVDVKVQKTLPQGSGIVFNVSSTPNINCHEFGSGQGMLDLDVGIYHFRFMLNHQALTEVQFEVK